jgi:hypothetical protein
MALNDEQFVLNIVSDAGQPSRTKPRKGYAHLRLAFAETLQDRCLRIWAIVLLSCGGVKLPAGDSPHYYCLQTQRFDRASELHVEAVHVLEETQTIHLTPSL